MFFSRFTQNFQILLKQALVANRVDYVTVLLQEENVKFDREQFPYIYTKVGLKFNLRDKPYLSGFLNIAIECSFKMLLLAFSA